MSVEPDPLLRKGGTRPPVVAPVVALGVALVAGLAAGCGSIDPNGAGSGGPPWGAASPLATSEPLLTAAHGRPDGFLESLPPDLDPRVVAGVAWISGESVEAGHWLERRLDALEVRELDPCMAREGHGGLLATRARNRARQQQSTVYLTFPQPAVLAEVGLAPTTVPDPRWTVEETGALTRCRVVPHARWVADARSLYQELLQDYHHQATEAIGEVRATAAQRSFADCLVRRGYPAIAGTSPDGFVAWVQRHPDPADPARRRAGRDYAECGEPIWNLWRQARIEVRADFVRQRADGLRELSAALARDPAAHD